jgi:hypothetical protein
MPHSWSGGFGDEKYLLPSYDRYGEFFFKGANKSRGHPFHDSDFASLFHCPVICQNKHVMKCEVEGQWGGCPVSFLTVHSVRPLKTETVTCTEI